jgi:hypothetical protein
MPPTITSSGGRARFQCLHRHCIRIEYDPEGKFLDQPTLFARERQTARGEWTVARKGRRLTLSTGAIELCCLDDGQPLGPGNLSARIRRGDEWVVWRPGQANFGNLGGTLRTLDGVREAQPLPPGLLSRDGWFLLDDSGTPVLAADGWVKSRAQEGATDWYLFGYGMDYRAAFQALAAISGPVPRPRRYCLGAWYSRYWPYSDAEFRRLVREYHEHDFPLDVMVMDMDWHINDIRRAPGAKAAFDNQVWTGYTWDRKLIAKPDKLLAWLREQGLAVTLNDHPADGVQPHEEMYAAFMRELGADPKSRQTLPFDAGDRRYLDAFLRHTHLPREKEGVDFWWLDWQQYPDTRSVAGLTNLQWLNYQYYEWQRSAGRRGASFSRWAGWGDHRHPIHFSGDADSGWPMLAYQVPFTATAGNVGCFFWSHDIGGHMGGRNEESYTRWCQFGAMSAALRSHSTRDKSMDRRPWGYPKWAEASMRRSFHLRSEFFPYLYSCVVQACRDTVPMLRPMYIEHAGREEAYVNPQQYFLGEHLLVAPVAMPGIGPRRLANQAVWFPPGAWYNVFTGERFEGPAERLAAADIDEFPLYVRAGAPLPTQPYTPRMGSEPLRELIIRIWPGTEGETVATELIEDDGMTEAYRNGEQAQTLLRCERRDDIHTVSIEPTAGVFRGQPAMRKVTLILHETLAPTAVTVDGRAVKAKYSDRDRKLTLALGARDIRQGCAIVVTAAAADPAVAAVAAYARRARLAAVPPGTTSAKLVAAAVARPDEIERELALRAAGIAFFDKNESPYGFPPEPDFFLYAPAEFAVDRKVTLRPGDGAEMHIPLGADGKTPVDSRQFTRRPRVPPDELLFPGQILSLTAEFKAAGHVVPCGHFSLPIIRPDWPFRRNLAPRATVTASSFLEGHLASAAVDGVVDGWPGNHAHEWATRQEQAGAWLKLEWPEPVTVGRVLLFDRPNQADHIVAGRLVFDDGSVFAVGELPADGKTPFELVFRPRRVHWMVFVITSVSATTQWTGLAEIAVYGKKRKNT